MNSGLWITFSGKVAAAGAGACRWPRAAATPPSLVLAGAADDATEHLPKSATDITT